MFSAQLHKYEGYMVRKSVGMSLPSSFSSQPGFTLIVTALLPPDAVQRSIAMVNHGLADLFG